MDALDVANKHIRVSSLGLEDEAAKKEKALVAVRIRPLLEVEQLAHKRAAWQAVGSNTLQYRDPDKPAGQCATYQYNWVFADHCSSEHVYAETAESLVVAALQGYNSTIIAYGQTGSGKTYTMQAIMAQAARDVFQLISESVGREFIIRLAAVEIYNEVVRDLLRDSSPALKLVDDPIKGSVAESLTEAGVHSVQHLQQVLAQAETRRQTRATRMNNNSSRSHEIVRLYIESRPVEDSTGCDEQAASSALQSPLSAASPAAAAGADKALAASAAAAVTAATISFVDLAGNECIAQAAVAGDKEKQRQKEASNINKSLVTLASVIRALADASGKRHIPYRDSKLTRLLQQPLSGNSHMVILTTISPASGAAESTRAALQFATAAGRVVMCPQVNQVTRGKAVIQAVASEVQQLRAQLADLESRSVTAAQQHKQADANQQQDAVRSKLQQLQKQILRGNSGALKVDRT
eukprot:GHRR01007000.1.p1 GENE.GHRR01007000.1~~GHRR01007000.1.p1  ORF type:complete len:466 (+),score=207.37 GHRR01007000.1:2031-3428(+)